MTSGDTVRGSWVAETTMADELLRSIRVDFTQAYVRLSELGKRGFFGKKKKPNVAESLKNAVKHIDALLKLPVVKESPYGKDSIKLVSEALSELSQQPITEATKEKLIATLKQKKSDFSDAESKIRTGVLTLRTTLNNTG